MCRFSDAGDDEAGDRLEDRRLKSAEARNRGKWGHLRCRGLYGDLAAASGWARLVRAPAQLLCLAGWALPDRVGGVIAGRFYRSAASGDSAGQGPAGMASVTGWWIGGEGIMRCRS